MSDRLDLRAIGAAKAQAKADLMRAIGGLPADVPTPEPETVESTATGLDGGARTSVSPPAETHEQTLARILSSREADRGSGFGG